MRALQWLQQPGVGFAEPLGKLIGQLLAGISGLLPDAYARVVVMGVMIEVMSVW